jgi:hypothetical protein
MIFIMNILLEMLKMMFHLIEYQQLNRFQEEI